MAQKSEKYIVFDIETAGYDFESLNEKQQEYLLRRAKTEEEAEKTKFELSLYPYTAQVVCIGLQLMEKTGDGFFELTNKKALSTKLEPIENEGEEITLSNGDKCLIYSEKKLLETFWAILDKYRDASLVSFNGRNFDCPFLMLRSAVHRIRPSRNLMHGTKFNYNQHIDLIDELTYYSGSQYGPLRKFNFDFFAHAFGIVSPKAEGVDGSMVRELFNEGQIETIAEYCLRDVNATWDLFSVWYNYLKF